MAEETIPGPPPLPAKKSVFAPKPPPLAPDTGMRDQLNAMAARVRISEERYSELRKKMLFIEQNMLTGHKRAMNEIKSSQSDINEIKRTIQVVEDKIITIIKEIRLTARKEDIDVMKRYLELWNPVKFVSQETVEKIIEEKLSPKEQELLKPHTYDSPS